MVSQLNDALLVFHQELFVRQGVNITKTTMLGSPECYAPLPTSDGKHDTVFLSNWSFETNLKL